MAKKKIGAPVGCFRKYLGVFAVLAATGIPTVQAANPFATVATVGEDIITRYEVDQYIAIRTHNTNIPNSPEFEQQALSELIDARLIAKEARRYRVSVSRSEVTRSLDLNAQRDGISANTLLRDYARVGVTEESLRGVLHTQILIRRLAHALFVDRISTEVDPDALEARIAAYENDQPIAYHLFEIDLGVLDDPARLQSLVNGIQKRIDRGEQFSNIAVRISRADNAAEGGERGWFTDTQLTPEMLAVVQNIPIGGISPPLHLPSGETRIIHVADRAARTLPGVTPWSVSMEIFLAPATAEEDREQALARVTQAHQQIRECGAELPDSLAVERRILQDVATADLPSAQRDAAISLNVQEATQPVLTPEGASFLLLCDRTGGISEQSRERVTKELAAELGFERMEQLWTAHLSGLRARAIITRKDP